MTTYPERAQIEKFLILNFLEIIDMIGGEKERILSLFRSIRKALDEDQIVDSQVIADDNCDTTWFFEIKKVENGIYYIEYLSTAK